MDRRVLALGAPGVAAALAASASAERKAPAPVKSLREIAEERERNQHQVIRHYSLMSWLSKNGLIHRTNPGKCQGCTKTISSNKTHCAACAPKE